MMYFDILLFHCYNKCYDISSKKKITFSFVKSSNKFLTLGSAHVLYT